MRKLAEKEEVACRPCVCEPVQTSSISANELSRSARGSLQFLFSLVQTISRSRNIQRVMLSDREASQFLSSCDRGSLAKLILSCRRPWNDSLRTNGPCEVDCRLTAASLAR